MVYQITGITRRINRESTSGRTIHKLPLTNRSGLGVLDNFLGSWFLQRHLVVAWYLLARLEAGFDEGKSSFDSGLARLVPAFVMGRLEADCFSAEI